MGRKEITTKEDLMKVIELVENTGITYWLDGGWGVDILAGKQTRIHSCLLYTSLCIRFYSLCFRWV